MLLSKLEELLTKDDWEDHDKISQIFDQLGEEILIGEDYQRYLFLLGRF